MEMSFCRGNRIYFDDLMLVWKYVDDTTLVSDHWKEKPCGHCGKKCNDEGHDNCIVKLPGVKNACCGHGDISDAYIQFDDGRHFSGGAAWIVLGMIKNLGL